MVQLFCFLLFVFLLIGIVLGCDTSTLQSPVVFKIPTFAARLSTGGNLNGFSGTSNWGFKTTGPFYTHSNITFDLCANIDSSVPLLSYATNLELTISNNQTLIYQYTNQFNLTNFNSTSNCTFGYLVIPEAIPLTSIDDSTILSITDDRGSSLAVYYINGIEEIFESFAPPLPTIN